MMHFRDITCIKTWPVGTRCPTQDPILSTSTKTPPTFFLAHRSAFGAYADAFLRILIITGMFVVSTLLQNRHLRLIEPDVMNRLRNIHRCTLNY